MSEIPTAPEHEAAQDALLQKVQAEGSGLDVSDELEADHQAELAEGNITHLRSFLTGQEGEDAETVAAEQTALRAAVTEVAEAHEGVSETLIMMWINGEEISDQMVGLHERGVRTFRDLRDDPDAVRTIQQIGVDLGLDLGEEGVNGDYNEATEEAMRQLQSALVEAGYDLGEFGPNNDGIDGAIGQVSMNIMMNAARSVAPDAVVEDAIAEVTFEDRSVERRTNEFIAIGVDGEGEALTPREGEISAEHIGEYASVLARGMEGVQYDSENQTFTHTLTDETLPVADVVSGNYEDVNRADMQSGLSDFSTAQVTAFATAQGVEVVDHEGNPHFEQEGRKMSVEDILSDQQPIEMFEQWKSGTIEGVEAEGSDTELPAGSEIFGANEEEIQTFAQANGVNFARRNGVPSFMRPGGDFISLEAVLTNDDPLAYVPQWGAGEVSDEDGEDALNSLRTHVRGITGVKNIETRDGAEVVILFDGTPIALADINTALNGATPNTSFLETLIDGKAHELAETEGLNLDYIPANLTGTIIPAHFTRDGIQVFALSEIAEGQLDETSNPGNLTSEERNPVLQEALAAMATEG